MPVTRMFFCTVPLCLSRSPSTRSFSIWPHHHPSPLDDGIPLLAPGSAQLSSPILRSIISNLVPRSSTQIQIPKTLNATVAGCEQASFNFGRGREEAVKTWTGQTQRGTGNVHNPSTEIGDTQISFHSKNVQKESWHFRNLTSKVFATPCSRVYVMQKYTSFH